MEKEQVYDALMRLEWAFHPDNPDRVDSLSSFWIGPRGGCPETHCYRVANYRPSLGRELVRLLSAEITQWYPLTAGSPSRTIHRFNAMPQTTPLTLYYLASAARERFGVRHDLQPLTTEAPVILAS